MKTLFALFTIALLCLSAAAQTPITTNNPPTVSGALTQLEQAIQSGNTNWLFEAHGLYAPKLDKRYGGGFGALYPLSTFVVTGVRLDYVDGGFWLPSGNATFQVPVQLRSWLQVTPFTYAGVGVPLSGAKIGTRDNNGQATAILGYGGALRVYTGKKWLLDIVGDRERWTGFAGYQYRVGLLAKFSF